MANKNKRYSEVIKRQVVSEYEAGTSIPELQKKYGIGGSPTIARWIRKYGKQGYREQTIYIQSADEIDRIKELEKQVKELQQMLGRMTLEKLKLESVLEALQVNAEIVKKNDRTSSGYSPRKSLGTEAG